MITSCEYVKMWKEMEGHHGLFQVIVLAFTWRVENYAKRQLG